MRYKALQSMEFKCLHCGNLVSTAQMMSGVNNRNHCPYCLWSCHLDLFVAGDRLSACKEKMKPIGLTMKKSRNKYRPASVGELMLIHLCIDCHTLSINRIAADDDTEAILTLFQDSLAYSDHWHAQCSKQGIDLLGAKNKEMIYQQLFGQNMEVSYSN